MDTKNLILSFTIFTLYMPGLLYAQEETEIGLKVVPPDIAVESGDTVTLECILYPEDSEQEVIVDWFRPGENVSITHLLRNQSAINLTNSDILRFSSENNSLEIANASKKDGGIYVCKSQDGSLQVEALVKVYDMPSYFTEAMVVIGINVALVVVFLACSVWTFFRDRKEKQEQQRRSKLGQKVLVKRALYD